VGFASGKPEIPCASIAFVEFLFQHAIQVWCPPAELLARTGFRTSREVETERVALKVLHSDFKDVAKL
jgi:hypothetical protein